MNLLMISTDRNLFNPQSPVTLRQIKLLDQCDQIDIVVFSKNKLINVKIDPRVCVYSTRSYSKWLYILDAYILGKKLIQSNKISNITCQDLFETGLVGVWLKAKFNLTLELQVHTDPGSPYFGQVSLLNRLRLLVLKYTLPKADHVRLVSSRVKNFVTKFLDSSKVEIRPIVVDVEKIKNHPITIDLHKKYPQFRKIILMVSRLEPEKNVSLAVKSFVLINRIDPSIGLVIVGDGRERTKLETLVKKIKAPIVFEGWVSDPISYYKTADLFLNTSWYEGYGLSLVEANTVGLPIISTDVGVAKELGAHIVPYDERLIADKLSQLLL